MTGSGNHTYLLVGENRLAALIDAGGGEARHLDEIATQLSATGSQLTSVLVTHAHRDHAAGAPALKSAHPQARFHKFPSPNEDHAYAVPWEPLRDGDALVAGDEPLIVLHTPGHSPDHVAFWHEPSRTAFTGDLVVQHSSVMIAASQGGDLRQYLASLRRIEALGPERLLPAHGPEISDPASVLRQYLDHRAMRERQVISALAGGRTTVQAIAECIYDGLDPALMPAARETVRAHLEKLESEGRAFEAGGSWGTRGH